MNKKILILTLGVGSVFGKDGREWENKSAEEKEYRIQEMIVDDIYPYDKTDYIVEKADNKDYVVSSEYVAEIQIKEFQPDMVIIIGTVKSSWSMFYRKFTQNSENESLEDVMTLYHIEQDENNGINTDGNKLKEIEAKIQSIYNNKLDFQTGKDIDIKVCLIRYGVNNAELAENYAYISGIEKYLEENTKYEVAFDITHSFRSLPIYNLVILNYLQQVSKFDIQISHIYYGNFDVKRENGGKAPLIDLADISEVLNLTNAVSEFKNTGRPTSLIKILPTSEEDLKKALIKFDEATQLNVIDEIISSLKKLAVILNTKTDKRSKYVDAKKMLKAVLSEDNSNLLEISKCKNKGEEQLLLAKWYLRQDQIGKASLVSIESLKSFLVPFHKNDLKQHLDKLPDESELRSEAMYRLKCCEDSKLKTLSPDIMNLLIRLREHGLYDVVSIRNKYSHNLSIFIETNNGNTTTKKFTYSSGKTSVKKFINDLEDLKDCIQNNKNKFQNIYCSIPRTLPKSNKKSR
jgi:CRISPR-associated Csx2 family protein